MEVRKAIITAAGRGARLYPAATTVDKGIYAFIFDQKGVMAGLGIQGSKITKLDK